MNGQDQGPKSLRLKDVMTPQTMKRLNAMEFIPYYPVSRDIEVARAPMGLSLSPEEIQANVDAVIDGYRKHIFERDTAENILMGYGGAGIDLIVTKRDPNG